MSAMAVDVAIAAAKALFIIFVVLQVMGMGVFFERKVSAIIQDRIGANRAAIFGVAAFGIVNTLVADPIKFLLKEDVRPAGADKLLHTLAPILSVIPALAAFAVLPFGDVLILEDGSHINLQAAALNVGMLYVLAMASLGVYGVVLAGWASNNRWSLLGGIRGSAQMISYEIAMGLALIGVVLVYDTLDLQAMARAQGHMIFGWIPAWGVIYQPVGFLIFLTAGIAESKRIPFDLPESESELVSGYFTEYSGAKHLMFMMADFVEVVLVSGLVTTIFFGGWQVPFLGREGFVFPGGHYLDLPSLVVVLLQVTSFILKMIFFTWLQIVLRWTLPRFRYDQLMTLGWKGLLPLALVNVIVTAFLVLLFEGRA